MDGYLKDSKGRLVPLETIDALTLLRDEQVRKIIGKAKVLQQEMRKVKAEISQMITEYMEMSAREYGVKYGGEKGNVSLPTFDGAAKVVVAVSEQMAFDERLQHAQQLVTQCLRNWSVGSSAELRALVEEAFTPDKAGNINRWQVMRLLRVQSEDDQWKEAMRAIRDSMFVEGTKEYMRLYERPKADAKMEMISLDFSSM